jgi:transposase
MTTSLSERFSYRLPQCHIAKDIGFTRMTVRKHARMLGSVRKQSPTRRNYEARALVEMEYNNLTYKEMAKRTGLTVATSIENIVRELGLKRSREQLITNISKGRQETNRKERARIIYGLDQKTKLKFFSNKSKIRLRGKLKKLGYIVKKGDSTFYYTDDLQRNPRLEENGKAFRFKFMPLPEMCVEETIHDSASPAISANG